MTSIINLANQHTIDELIAMAHVILNDPKSIVRYGDQDFYNESATARIDRLIDAIKYKRAEERRLRSEEVMHVRSEN